MSIKTTRRISRAEAILLLCAELPSAPNDTLSDLLNLIADSGYSLGLSKFDDFQVSDVEERLR